MSDRPEVGLGVAIIKDGKVLLGKRKNVHGEGSWCFPGGRLEFGETWEECAKRETREEAGIEIKNLRLGPITNDIFLKEGKHYVIIIMLADYDSGEVRIMEPEKNERWDWFVWDSLPSPLFIPLQNLVKQGFNPVSLRKN